ncbi:MAG: GNAT family N-acetyltransferase [Candidatus Eisenbacteria bacterium]
MSRTVRVREAASRSDHEKAAMLFIEYAGALGFGLDFQDFEKELRDLPGCYAGPRGRVLLGFVDNELAGCVAMRPLGETTCEMKRLFVRDGFRGAGLGRALAEAVIICAREAGYATMRLDTLASMAEANALYASLGFDEIEPYYHNPIPSAVFFELRLLGDGP